MSVHTMAAIGGLACLALLLGGCTQLNPAGTPSAWVQAELGQLVLHKDQGTIEKGPTPYCRP